MARPADDFTIFVLSPAGLADPALAIAGCRAGAVGVINAELPLPDGALAPALDRMARLAGAPYGLKLDGADEDTLALAQGFHHRGLATLIVDAAAAAHHAERLAPFRAAGGRVLVEITEWLPELASLAASVDGWWAKGHESGGWVGEPCSFVLLQQMTSATDLPFFMRGGINVHSAAGCAVGGAAGVVLDDQLLLLRESPLAATLEPHMRFFTGQETVLVDGGAPGRHVRIWSTPGLKPARALKDEIVRGERDVAAAIRALAWRADADRPLTAPLGQDGAFALPWARRYGRVSAVIKALNDAVATQPAAAAQLDLLGEGTALARSHGTRWPIVQGPMTHVSDRAGFIDAVAAGGGLPMVALALMKGERAHELLQEVKATLGDKPWGVGLLGFVPPAILEQQRAAIREAKPRFAIIAGGRPDQSEQLEAAGIKTYLHVPSPVLLDQFLDAGARCFIFEGRECGGHIGPLSSLVLWGKMIDALLERPMSADEAADVHVLFAGGICSARSAATVAVLAAPLAERGIKVGLLMGTAYVYTREAVEAGAITDEFQRIAVEATHTVGLEAGPGHVARCVLTPFAEAFREARRDLERRRLAPPEVRERLEIFSLGRVRMASKGLARLTEGSDTLSPVPVARQRAEGMYMIGQVACLLDRRTTVADVHRAVTADATAVLAGFAETLPARATAAPPPADIAIVGVSAIMPKAETAREYWQNILEKVSCIGEIPQDRWDWRRYFDENPRARDKIYSRWGGFIDGVYFDPTRYGMPPSSIDSIDPMQLLALLAVQQALEDAGVAGRRDVPWEDTSVIMGFSGGLGDLGLRYATRSELPRHQGEVDERTLEALPEWTSDSFAGVLPNVTSGRVANRFDLGGLNCTVDAACASSLAAIYHAVLELQAGRSDMVVAGGLDTLQAPFGFLCFSKTQALSPTGTVRPFDADTDGIVISEGLAVVVLKRLADAARDGDRIYAVIKGVGASSDGRAKGLTAPLPRGQQRALRRAYAQAGFSPATVGLFEAHGTGTVAGDRAELETVIGVLREHDAPPNVAAIGSVKAMIGHTKAAAGVAGLLKAALALHHQVVPPHMGVEKPNTALAEAGCPVFINGETRPWVRSPDHPRRAAVSSFGFGGTNFHVALEAYEGDYRLDARSAPTGHWPAELFAWRGADRAAVVTAVERYLESLDASPPQSLAALSQATLDAARPDQPAALAFAATSVDDVSRKLTAALAWLKSATPAAPLPPHVHFAAAPLAADGKVAALFPGQGSQYPDMLRETAVAFPEMIDVLDRAEAAVATLPTFQRRSLPSLARLIYPPDRFTPEQDQAARRELTSTDVAQPALGAVEAALWALLRELGLAADMAAGHSYGEYVALHAAGALTFDDLMRVSEARGRVIVEAAAGGDLGTMAAVTADADTVRRVLGERTDLVIANINGPRQTVISGSSAAIAEAVERLAKEEITATPLVVAAAFHSPIMAPAKVPLEAQIDQCRWAAPAAFPVYSNTTAGRHADGADGLRALLAEHLVKPVDFAGMIQAMYDDGTRIFLEVGPRSVLADLTRTILGDRPHLAVSLDGAGGGLFGFLSGLAALLAHGVGLDHHRLFARRRVARDEAVAMPAGRRRPPSPQARLVNGGAALRVDAEGMPLQARRAPHAAPHAAPLGAVPRPAVAEPVAGLVAGPGAEPAAISTDAPPAASFDRPPEPATTILIPRKDRLMSADSLSSAAAWPPQGIDQVMADHHRMLRQLLQTQERLLLTYISGASEGVLQYQPMLGYEPMPDVLSDEPQPKVQNGGNGTRATVGAAPPAAELGSMSFPDAAANGANGTNGTNGHAVAAAVAPASNGNAAEPSNGVASPAGTAAAAPSTAPAPAAVDFKSLLLDVVSDRTGYPPDMLDLDQDLEADLGIDSIKRAEILGAFRTSAPAELGERLAGEMQDLSSLNSLRAILDFVAAKAGGEASTRPFELAGGAPETVCVPLPRYVIHAQAESANGVLLEEPRAGLYVITADDRGVAEILAERLEADGLRPLVVPRPLLLDEGRLGKWLTEERQYGPVRALLHLAPLDRAALDDATSFAAWRERVRVDVKAMFPLLRLLENELREGGRVVAASACGGWFGRDVLERGASPDFFPSGGGGVGLIKSLSLEWQACRTKAVDLDPAEDARRMAERVHTELLLPGGRREVGYPSGQRTIFRTIPASLTPETPALREPDESWVVLATGGARGITAETLRDLAAAKVTLVLVGRSPLPDEEPEETRDLASADALRSHFLAAAKASGEKVTPAAVERRLKALLRDRELTANIGSLEAAGARVSYRVADLKDEAAVADLIRGMYAEYGRIDVVLHGAGLIEDQWVGKKTADSIERVIDTKVDSAFLVTRHLRPETLRFVAFFTSVAGRYGNAGQTDYSAANETLNRLAWQLQARWGPDVKVSAINWGPWAGTANGPGMVTAEVRRQFEARGVVLVEPEQGRRFVMQELCDAPAAEVEVVAGMSPWEYVEARHGRLPTAPAPAIPASLTLLATARPVATTGARRSLTKTVDLVNDPYLDHHRIDGLPVMPFVCATEHMAEAVLALGFGDRIAALRDVRLFRGLIVKDGTVDIRIDAEETAPGEIGVSIWAEEKRPAYRSVVLLGQPRDPIAAPSRPVRGEPLDIAAAYSHWMFLGPDFQTVKSISSMGPDHVRARVRTVPGRRFYPPAEEGTFVLNPGIMDAALQLVSIWSRKTVGRSALPLRIGRITRFDDEPLPGELDVNVDVLSGPHSREIRTNATVSDDAGRLRLLLEDVFLMSDPALNRLGGQWAGGKRGKAPA